MINDKFKRERRREEDPPEIFYDNLFQICMKLLNSDDSIKRVSLIGQDKFPLINLSKYSYSVLDIDENSFEEFREKALNSNVGEIISTEINSLKFLACKCRNNRILLVYYVEGDLSTITSHIKATCQKIAYFRPVYNEF